MSPGHAHAGAKEGLLPPGRGGDGCTGSARRAESTDRLGPLSCAARAPTPEGLRETLGKEGRAFADSARRCREEAPVSGASGRTAGETVRHLVGEYDAALGRLDTRQRTASAQATPEQVTPGRTDVAAPVERFVDRLAALLAEFGTRSPWESCSTWWPADGTVRFWLRRLTHATLLGRVDVESATGEGHGPVPTAIAEDGIDEVLRLWFAHRLPVLGMAGTHPCAVHVRTPGNSWMACADERGVALWPPRECPRGADAVVTGDPDRVYLWLWGRLPDRAVTIAGDVRATAQLWGLLRLSTHGVS
ncbi:maleylpyruvate isomerase family mycothiol-dependent enzyme [Salinifilum aidingensis]